MTETRNDEFRVSVIWISCFEFVSDFEIRISDFPDSDFEIRISDFPDSDFEIRIYFS